EFVIIMLDTNLDEAYNISERVRKSIEKHEFPTVGNITVSFGLAEKLRFEEFYHWYNRVDEALYEAKESGRNRTVVSKENKIIQDDIEQIISTDWKSGHFHIDKQHKMLMEEANQLMIIYHAKDVNPKQYMKQLDYVLELIATHFKDEERIIKELGYPNADEHKKIHDYLLNKAYDLKESCLKGDMEYSTLFSFIVDEVIVKHSLITDKEYFEYTRKGEHS
ncbi:MAG: diguanylate cyclase, partial [Lysinibacillus sp.]|nr:diguanylate cyclase [Lysinibacillus sp.]